MSRETPPPHDAFELSVIGPGRGECVILHLGQNNWCVIDSCTTAGSKLPVSVEYLSAFGQTALDGVRLLVATHWHDDHIRGISSALRAFPNAKFCCSVALEARQFVSLVELSAESLQGNSGLDEFHEIYQVLIERRDSLRERYVAPAFAIVNRELLRLPSVDAGTSASIVALSPSDGSFRESLRWISSLMPQPGQIQRRIADVTPNTTSVVLWVASGRHSVLLGADLEHNLDPAVGWLAVVASREHTALADLFKVPHHGSANADCPEVWTMMLEENPIAIVTPFAPSGLPRDVDLRRLAARTRRLYCTSVGRRKPPRRDLVDKLLKGVERYAIDPKLGHVRIRSPLIAEGPTVLELFNGAFAVSP